MPLTALDVYREVLQHQSTPELRAEKFLLEERAPRVGTTQPTFNKQLMAYEDSKARVSRIHSDGRHLRTDEAFALIIAHLEGKLQPFLQAAVDDMLIPHSGEWLNDANQYNKITGIMTYFVDADGLQYDREQYKAPRLTFSERHEFRIPAAIVEKYKFTAKPVEIPVSLLSDEHQRFLYNRAYHDLPRAMKEGSTTATIQLPEPGIWPLSRGGWSAGEGSFIPAAHNLIYSTVSQIDSPYQVRASRGYLPAVPRKGPGIETAVEST